MSHLSKRQSVSSARLKKQGVSKVNLCEHGSYHCQICEVRLLDIVCKEQKETLERYKKALEYIAEFNSSESAAQHLQTVAKNTIG